MPSESNPTQWTEQRSMELMQTLDDSWNVQNWDTFDRRHTRGAVRTSRSTEAHGARESIRFHGED